MRKLLVTALLASVLSAACNTTTPVGPGKVVVTTASTTTTSVVPTSTALRFVGFQALPTIPSDMTLFVQLAPGSSSLSSSFLHRIQILPAQAGATYTVVGVYSTQGGGAGSVNGQMIGGALVPLDPATFTGTLTAVTSGCTAVRQFSGTVTSQILQWAGGQTAQDCAGSPLGFQSLTLLKSDAPPPTSTIAPSSTTTSVLTSSTTTTSTVPPVGSASAHYVGTFTPSGSGPIPADLSLFFSLLSGGSSARSLFSIRTIGPAAATSYVVTGGYNTGPNGFTGTISGTLDGTPNSGAFTGVLTANMPNCIAQRPYSGQLTQSTLAWTPGNPPIETCMGTSPLTFPVTTPAATTPATTTIPGPPTTSTTSTSTTTTTTVPTFTLSVAGNAQPFCTSVSIQSNPSLGFPSVTVAGPFQTTGHTVAAGTVVQLSISGPGAISWSNCDSIVSGVCTVTMNSDRCGGCALPPPTVAIAQTCTTTTTSTSTIPSTSTTTTTPSTSTTSIPIPGEE
jgi:hypothetical protein